MSMYLAIRTKMSGLPHPHLGLDDKSQPRLLHFTGITFDKSGNELDHLTTPVDLQLADKGQTDSSEGLIDTLEPSRNQGMDAIDVIRWFRTRARKVDCLIGHNIHLHVINMAIAGAQATSRGYIPPCRLYCTALHSLPFVHSAPTDEMMLAGKYHPKMPTLGECVEQLLGVDSPEPPDALAEVNACIRIFRHLVQERNRTV
ncbi:hypothetical protein DVR09_00695 [Erythrobacter aureus]|uniref:Exonuclease domain-containing protein n=1 Tax=Erythrobacter aureus TaxID=2182384 RepID=A0A345YAT9_9SPHN|nr:hypothetical protein DVR09_00695 [Erythrobacter aureus]